MKLKNAGIKSVREAVERMMNGEVFYFEGAKLFYDDSRKGINPFRVIYTNGMQNNIAMLFECVEQWDQAINWQDDLAHGPILCHIWTDEDNKLDRFVGFIHEVEDNKYLDQSGYFWEHAEPVTADWLWNPDRPES